jgi:type I restriction-modification system DNA methylase subunit
VYNLDDLLKLKNLIIGEQPQADSNTSAKEAADSKTIKRVISKLHSVFRDSDANSSILIRFDEISKLLFLKFYAEKGKEDFFSTKGSEDIASYSTRIRSKYRESIMALPGEIPSTYKQIIASDICIYKCGIELSKFEICDGAFDIKGLAYEDMVKGTFDKNDNQQFFTPPQIVSFMAKIMDRYLKGSVCDPACGTAGFLTQVSKLKRNMHLVGLEIDDRLSWISKMNLLLHGSKSFEICCLKGGGTLGHQASKYYNKFDAILTNPPFGSDYTEKSILNEFSLGKGKSSRRRGILFIERAWKLLKKNGVLGIVIDQGVLNSSSTSDVREFILSHYKVLSIIDLPETAFMPYATVSTSILLLKKVSAPTKSEAVFYAKADRIGRKFNGDDDIIYSKYGEASLNSDLDTIVKNWDLFCENNFSVQKDQCYVANISSALATDNSLRLDYAYHHPFRNTSKRILEDAKCSLASIADLCTERNISYIPSADSIAQTIMFTGLANIESNSGAASQISTPSASIKSAVKRYEKDDIVFSKMRPSLRKVAVMNFEKGGYVSSECVVLTVKKDATGRHLIEPELLAALLRSDLVYGQILHHITGIGRPRIGASELRRVKVPLVPQDLQEQGKAMLDGQLSIVTQLRDKARSLAEEADAMEISIVNALANKLMEAVS